jgi:hypothetical protein
MSQEVTPQPILLFEGFQARLMGSNELQLPFLLRGLHGSQKPEGNESCQCASNRLDG